jgi:hypothetical protein
MIKIRDFICPICKVDYAVIDMEVPEYCEYCEKRGGFKIYDFIGDVHGEFDKLESLLLGKGYESNGISFYSSNRTAVFVGDFVDKGPDSLKVLQLVKKMVDEDNAIVVLGNHDWNWIRFNTLNEKGGYLRDHSLDNLHQNAETRAVWKNADEVEQKSLLEWLSKLPFWIKDEKFGVVHACWDEEAIEKLQDYGVFCFEDYYKLISHYDINHETVKNVEQKIDQILCGPEETLPDGKTFKDDKGKVRNKYRVKWWGIAECKNLSDAFVKAEDHFTGSDLIDLKGYSVPKAKLKERSFNGPVFFGHYNLPRKDFDSLNLSICLDIKGEILAQSMFQSFNNFEPLISHTL